MESEYFALVEALKWLSSSLVHQSWECNRNHHKVVQTSPVMNRCESYS